MNKNTLTILAVLGTMTLWILSGVLKKEPVSAIKTREERTTVRVRRSLAQEIPKEVRFTGYTVPNRRVQVKAETEGVIISLGAQRGDRVLEGQVLAVVALKDREDRVAAAKAALAQRKIEFNAATKLFEKRLVSESQYTQALAGLREAQAQLKHLELDLKDTHIFCPFSGVLESRPVELGSYVRRGETVIGTLIDLEPMKVEGAVTEKDIALLDSGMPCSLKSPSGDTFEGTVSYVSKDGDLATRTFAVEIVLKDAEATLQAGLTVDASIVTQQISAHSFPPSLLSLSEEGMLGIKTVDDFGTVHFHAAELVRAEQTQVWLSGLPEEISVISTGQGFVQDGDSVLYKDEADTQAPSSTPS